MVAAHFLTLVLYAVALLGLLLYGLNAYVMIALHWWTRRGTYAATLPPDPPVWPLVTVQLPLYNERYVAGRLLEAAAALASPAPRPSSHAPACSTADTARLPAPAAHAPPP